MKVTKLIGAAVLTTLIAGCANNGGTSPSDNTSNQTGPIKIGVIVPLSGPAGPNGAEVLEAIKVQADLINKAGGVLKRQLEVISKDDQSTPAAGVSAATDLVSQGVSVVMGGWNSPVTLAIQPVLVKSGVLNITSIPQNASIIGGADPNAVRMNAGNAVGSYAAGQYIGKTLKAKTVAYLLENDAYGNDAGTFLTKQLEPMGIKVVTEQKFAYTDTDFRVPISNIASANPDVVFSANAAESSGMPVMAKQYAESSLKAPHFAALGTVSAKVVKLAGGAAIDGLLSADDYFPGAPQFTNIPENKAFSAAYQKTSGGELPSKYAALGAQSVDIWAKAVTKAGSTDQQKVSKAIHGKSFTGTIFGNVSFTDKGQMKTKIYALTVEAGAIKVLNEIPIPDDVWQQ